MKDKLDRSPVKGRTEGSKGARGHIDSRDSVLCGGGGCLYRCYMGLRLSGPRACPGASTLMGQRQEEQEYIQHPAG